jgi:hypothetical protein
MVSGMVGLGSGYCLFGCFGDYNFVKNDPTGGRNAVHRQINNIYV